MFFITKSLFLNRLVIYFSQGTLSVYIYSLNSVYIMTEIYDDLIGLIEKWKAFKKMAPEGNLTGFGQWLCGQEAPKEENRLGESERFIVQRSKRMKERNTTPDLTNRAIIGSLLGRLTHFVKNYTKLPFQELGLGSMEEFKILSLIDRMKNPNKSMLSHAALMEFTTINDMLKRFEKKGWIRQEQDETDKRASRIRLTQQGATFLRRVYKTLANLKPGLTGDLSPAEQQQLMGLLIRLNQFHTEYFDRHFSKKGSIER